MVSLKKSVAKPERATENLHIRITKTDLLVIRNRIRCIRNFIAELKRLGVTVSAGHTVGKIICDALDMYSVSLKSRVDMVADDISNGSVSRTDKESL